MANCKHETSNGRCGLKGCYAYRHKCYTEEFCKCHQPQTNADRIRAMSDEELALFLCGVYDDDDGITAEYCSKFIDGTIINDYDEDKICEWLRQPAEE